MKKISILLLVIVAALASCKKVPEVNLKYVDVERDLITVGTTTATIQCDYEYIATLKKAYLYYGEGTDTINMSVAEMSVVQKTLYVELSDLKENTTYSYYYEFANGFNSMKSASKAFKTEGSGITITLPTVVTADVIEITSNSAKTGGEVTNDGGAEVTERGICWSTSANPTLNDSHVAAGTGTGAFTAMMSSLEANTTYHVRAYATNEKGTAYGLDRDFVTNSGGGGYDCDYVDLGLPSGTLWATCNVGANAPEEYGDYFAWGETEPKSLYDWSTYKYCHGDRNSMTKYCNMPDYGYNGFTDELTLLEANDDAATVNWGNEWCMPTADQWRELYNFTTTLWSIQNEVQGLLFMANNGNSLFLPAAGHYAEVGLCLAGINGVYGSNQLYTDDPSDNRCIQIGESNIYYGNEMTLRSNGLSVRAVRKTNTPTPPGNVPEGAIKGLFTINENGDQVYFSQGNLQYQASTNTWRFAEHQYSFVGGVDYQTGVDCGNVYENGVKCDNSLLSSSYDGWIDLFGWGTSGYNHGANCYEPWSTSQYGSDYFAYGIATCNLYDQTGQADWGYNAISNGGNTTGQWRTLTADEWFYIINSRTTTSGIRYAKVKVDEVRGVILLPDNWSTNIYSLNSTNIVSASYTSNIISALQWETLEVAGALFLPVGGYRVNDLVEWIDVGGYGTYWTSTCYNNNHACGLFFTDNSLYTQTYNYAGRIDGQLVRLVQDAN